MPHHRHDHARLDLTDDEGSLVTEYGLIAIVGATIASLVVKWATGGAIWELFGAVAQKVRSLLQA